MYRVYQYQDQILFIEDANSPIGVPIGIIVPVDDERWEFYPDRHRGYTARELEEITLKVETLNVQLNA